MLAVTAVVMMILAAQPAERVAVGSAPVEQAPSSIPEQHAADCWRGSQPPLVEYPGHVIVQHRDGRTVHSRRLVGPALDSLFGGKPAAFTVIAFCR